METYPAWKSTTTGVSLWITLVLKSASSWMLIICLLKCGADVWIEADTGIDVLTSWDLYDVAAKVLDKMRDEGCKDTLSPSSPLAICLCAIF